MTLQVSFDAAALTQQEASAVVALLSALGKIERTSAPAPVEPVAAPAPVVSAPAAPPPQAAPAAPPPVVSAPAAPPPQAAPAAPAPVVSAPTPESIAGGTGLDVDGVPWDERIHSGSKKRTASNRWARRKNLQDSYYESVTRELRGQGAAPSPDATAAMTTTAPPPPPTPPAPVEIASPSVSVPPPPPIAQEAPAAPAPAAAPTPPPAAPTASPPDAAAPSFVDVMQAFIAARKNGKNPEALLATLGITNMTAQIGSASGDAGAELRKAAYAGLVAL